MSNSALPEPPADETPAEASDDRADGRSDSSVRPGGWRELLTKEDWWAIWIGGFLLALMLLATWLSAGDGDTYKNPLKRWLATPSEWSANPANAFVREDGQATWPGMLGALGLLAIPFAFGAAACGQRAGKFLCGFVILFALAVVSFVLAEQELVAHYNLEYALWALFVGLVISNTVRTPRWMKESLRTEFFIKTGLVLLGAEVLVNQLLALGLPGVFVAWVVTPIVLITTFWFGQRILRIESPTLNMVISADMSVCGVSAAIATAAACKAKKEELSLAIGISLSFTVVMMVVMPAIIRAIGMSPILGGAWIGGTIDATGAVAAAGGMLGEEALAVATTVKMIQNILIGVVSFGVAVYWVTCVERHAPGERPGIVEVWRRFPKFVLGFLAASLVFSYLHSSVDGGPELVDATIKGGSKTLRNWCFCLAFVSIGLETNFRELARYLQGGKPLVLYVAGQCLNLTLTLFMAWLMFEKVFPGAAEALSK